MSRPWLLAALLLLAGFGARAAASDPLPSDPRPHPITIPAEATPLDPLHPVQTRAGDFTYAGGLWLKAPPAVHFGGFSDLKVDPRGAFISESDEGGLIRGRLRLADDGRLAGVDAVTFQPLTDETGHTLQRKFDADAEGVALWPDGDLMVSFERRHRIWLYPRTADGGVWGAPRSLPIPTVAMPENEGLEGLTLAPSHGPDAYWAGVEGGSIWLCHKTRPCQRWPRLMAPPAGHRLTALSETPWGDLVVLHHSFNRLTLQSRILASVLRLPRSSSEPAPLKAQLRLEPPATVDNFEGVAAVRSPQGGLRLYIISDDNFSPIQRTLLFAFDLPPGRPGAGPGPRQGASG